MDFEWTLNGMMPWLENVPAVNFVRSMKIPFGSKAGTQKS
jgi:hypothetical protein